jgi:hypothetical protein
MQIGDHTSIQAAQPFVSAPRQAQRDHTAARRDVVELSPAAQKLQEKNQEDQQEKPIEGTTASADAEAAEKADPTDPKNLSQEEHDQVKELKTRDREVKAHEQAHLAAAGPYARGGPSYEYQRGPDGKRYAVGGEVSIDTSPVSDDPEATIRKAQVIKRAATAPAEPSSQDRRVASEAAQMESEARRDLGEARRTEATGESLNAESDLDADTAPASPTSESTPAPGAESISASAPSPATGAVNSGSLNPPNDNRSQSPYSAAYAKGTTSANSANGILLDLFA